MKLQLPSGLFARLGCKIGNEKPKLERPLPPAAVGRPFRSVELKLTVFDTEGGQELGTIDGIGYCNPLDQFDKKEGRKRAIKRLFADNRAKNRAVLYDARDCAAVADAILGVKEKETEEAA